MLSRNRQTTVHVENSSSYDALPFRLPKMIVSNGDVMKLGRGGDVIRLFWSVFGDSSRYEVKFHDDEKWNPLVTTPTGARSVALQGNVASGVVFLLPRIGILSDYDWAYWDSEEDAEDDSDEPDEDGDAEEGVTGQDFLSASAGLVEQLLAIDAEVRAGIDRAPAPAWLVGAEYQTDSILAIEEETADLEAERARVAARLVDLADARERAIRTQDLIFEKGLRLERAVLHALDTMGVKAAPYRDGSSEFDSLFSIDGTRMLGEAEGRDNSPIAIAKISQLERNVAEDFARDDVEVHAKGVLFGNPQRLTKPEERDHLFTKKCLESAGRNKFALVLTADLFVPARYLERVEDKAYARQCREAILTTDGEIVGFPAPPTAGKGIARAGVAKTEARPAKSRARQTKNPRRRGGKSTPKR